MEAGGLMATKKQLKPSDGRLKANRDWNRFMMRAVHIPSTQRAKGEFHVEPVKTEADSVEVARAKFVEAWWQSLDADDRYTLAKAYTKRLT
jgi:O-succinylbenzoate synthase